MAEDGDLPEQQIVHQPTLEKLTAIIEAYKRTQSTEADTISAICQILYIEAPTAGVEVAKCREACASYIDIIRGITRDLEKRTPPLNRTPLGNPDTGTGVNDDGGQRGARVNHEDPPPFPFEQDGNTAGREDDRRARLRRTRDELEDDGDEAEDRPSKRSFNERLLPFVSSSSPISNLPPALVEINALKANYRADIATSLQWVHDAANLPQFPRALWKDLIQGYYIDFDKLLSTVRSISGDATESKKLGELEVQSEVIKITRRVTDKLEWSEAYTVWEDAVKFAFPCREKELAHYRSHINQLFSGTAVRFHCTVLEFDRAVRTRVGRSNNYLLTDYDRFNDLDKAHMSPIGAAAQTVFGYQPRVPQQPKTPRLPPTPHIGEICHRFNAGRKHDRCPYQHLCDVCGDPGHGRCDCPRRT